MKHSVLTTLLGVCLMAFVVNVNSKIIEVDSVEIEDISISLDAEASESTPAPETTEAPETTDAPATDAPPAVLNMEEVHQFIKHLMDTAGQMMNSVIDSVYEGNLVDIHFNQKPHLHSHHQQPRLLEHAHHHQRQHPVAVQQPEDFAEDEHVPIQPRTFNTLWWILKSILKTLRGINCSIKGVLNVKESTEQMLVNFQVCGVETTKQIQAVLDSAQEVLSIANDIIRINDNVCDNPDYLADNVDASAKASSKCVKQMRSKILKLNNQISTTTKLVKKVPSDAGDCVTSTFSNYQAAIVDFPNFVKSCAKL